MSRIVTYTWLLSGWIAFGYASAQDVDVNSPGSVEAAAEGAPLALREEAAPLEEPSPRPPRTTHPRLGAAWEHRLSNGLHLVGRQDPHHHNAAVCLAYGAGFGYDPPGFEGLAFLTQALHHNGITPHYPDGIRARFESGTGFERDVSGFCIDVPDAQLEEVLHAEAARMAYLLRSLTEEHVRAERRRLLEDGWQRSHLVRTAQRALFGEVRQFFQQAPLERIELSDVQWFHQQHYTPGNAVLAIVSRRPQDEVLAVAARYFEGVRGLAPPPPPPAAEASMEESLHIDVTGRSPRGVRLYWRTPAYFAEGDAELDLIAGHLRRKLRRELRSAALRIRVQQYSEGSDSLFAIEVDAPNNVDLEALATRLETTVYELSRRPLRDADMQAARNAFLRPEPEPSVRATSLSRSALRTGRLISAETNQQRLESLSAWDIRSAAGQFLSQPHVRILYRHAPQRESVLVRGTP